ncbi:MAG: PAS domain S-box protein [Sneathiella sp.]|nr:PAS domain S-box protein [Sneathiella sp.]
MTTTPTGVENGAVLLGYHANQNLPAEQKITSCSASFLRHQIGALIDEHQNETEKNQKTAQSAAYFSASMDVTLDSYIIYDEQDRVVAFSPNHLEFYPWLTGHLKVGANFADILQVVAYSGYMPDVEGKEEEWIQNRLGMRRGEVKQIDTTLNNGRAIRIREHPLPGGGWVASLTDITLFKQAEERIRNREKTYRHLLEASPDAIAIMQDGKIVFANEKVLDLFKADNQQQIIQTPYLNFIFEADLPTISGQINQFKDDQKHRFSCRMVRMDGTIFYADVTFASVEWDNRPATLFTTRDETDLRQLLEKLETQKKQLQNAQRLFRAGHWEYDFRGGIFRPSEQLAKLMGLKTGVREIPYQELLKIFPDEEYGRLERTILDGIEAKTSFDLEHRALFGDKEIFIQGRAEGIYDEEGNIETIFGISRDVTERKQLEDALHLNQKRFKDLALFVSDVFWELDTNGYFSYISSDIEELLGHKTSWYLRRHISDVFTDTEKETAPIQEMLACLNEKRAFKGIEFPRINPNTGDKRWFNSSAIPLFDLDGNFEGYRGYDTDVTERIKLEVQINRSQKLEAIGGLTGGIAHDFNNLLGIVLGNAEMLYEDLLEQKDKAGCTKVQNIISASNRGAELTHQMLAYAQNQPLAPTRICINKQVDNMLSLIRRTIGADIDIQVEHHKNLRETKADPNQVENAVLNMFLNARDAMSDGGEIVVRTSNCQVTESDQERLQLTPGEYICLTVEDNGSGIPEDIQDAIFDPFFTTKPVGQGSGLGLSMIMGFAKQSGGTVRVKSELGVGTAISVYLPAA